jgi:hypothetical protein
MKSVHVAFIALAALTLTASRPLAQFNNDCTTVVLHAVPSFQTTCQTDVDCTTVQPRTRLDNPSGPQTIYVFLKNYDTVGGVQVAFDWPLSWSLGFGLWQCQAGQITAAFPTAPGPITGSLTTAWFDQISGGALAPIGVMVFTALSPSGCLSIIESGYPFGNHVVANAKQVTHLRDENEGRVCVGADGWNTCDCRNATPVEGSTWGKIKTSYGW